MARFQNILDTIGNTPVVKLNRLAPPGVNVYVKVESFNPMGSVKDRMARAVIEDAESGVKAGATGPFGLVIGVDRGVGRDALIELGADVIVDELDELLPALERAGATSAPGGKNAADPDSPAAPSTEEDPA